MRKRDVHELLKIKRKGELEQMLQGLNTHGKYDGGFQGEFEYEGMDESKANESNLDPANFQYPFPGKNSPSPISASPSDGQNLIQSEQKEVQRVTLTQSGSAAIEGKSIVVRDTSSFVYNSPPSNNPHGRSPASMSSPGKSPSIGDSLSSEVSNGASDHSPADVFTNSSVQANWRIGSSRMVKPIDSAYRYSLRSNVTLGSSSRTGTMRSQQSDTNTIQSSARLSMLTSQSGSEARDRLSDGEETDQDDRRMSRAGTHTFAVFPYEILKSRSSNGNASFPAGVDRHNREQHLSEEEFQIIFKMDRVAFNKLTRWRRQELKKRYNLF